MIDFSIARFKKGALRYLPQAVVTLPVPDFKPLTEGLDAGPPLLTQAIQSANVADFLTTLFNIAISVGAILAVLRIGYAGFIYMTSDIISQKSNAREIIQNAVIGLLLLLAVVLILEQINPEILKINFDLSQGGVGQQGSFQGGEAGFPTTP